jgi:histidinol dehydrogenase
MRITAYPKKQEWSQLLRRPELNIAPLEKIVREVLTRVAKEGDSALRAYTLRFDQVKLDGFQVSAKTFEDAEQLLSPELKAAILHAADNISRFHQTQQQEPLKIETQPGVLCWRKSVAIEKVGLYIPGGSAPLFSTVLMLGIPAQLAGCKDIVLCTPPQKDGKVHPAVLFAAKCCGISQVYALGGVQAIAAMAYGTETIPRVYKIFGPGNQYVTCAKRLLAAEGIAIDMPAGPSEVAVFADATVPPVFVAADLLAQAEHGVDSQVLLVTTEQSVLETVQAELEQLIQQLPRAALAQKALQNSHAILVNSREEAMQLLNDYAPEHLILSCADVEQLAEKVVNAGSVFVGKWSPESVGDYASGTNHTLPTNGYATAWSGVSQDSFVKKITFQQLTPEGLLGIGSVVEVMAEAEGLTAHKLAVSIRIDYLTQQKN